MSASVTTALSPHSHAPERSEPASPAVAEPTSVAPGPGVGDSPAPEEERDGKAMTASPWVASTYFAEGLPFSLVHQVSAQYFTAMGASLSAIGLTSLYGLAWNLKFLWAPLVDRFGTARKWLFVSQLLLGAAVGLIAWPAATADLRTVAGLLVVVAVLGATQDIAIDGYYLRALGKKDQAALSGLRVGAYRSALLFGNGLIVVVAGRYSWLAGFAVASATLFLLSGAHAMWLPRAERGDVTASAGGGRAGIGYFGAFSTFFRQEKIGVILAFILLFRAGDALMFAMSTPLLDSLGLDTELRGWVGGVLGTAGSISGAVIGGALIARFGFSRTLVPITMVQSAAILLYVLLAVTRPPLPVIVTIVVVEQLVAGIGTAAFLVFLMRRCSSTYKASHFAIATALMSVASTVFGGTSGYLAMKTGFPLFFLIAFLVSIPGVVLSRFVPRE